MKESLKLVLIPTIICILAGALLAGVDAMTKGLIEQCAIEKKQDALNKVLPAYDNILTDTTAVITAAGKQWLFYVARKSGKFVGAAVETSSSAGYGGDISLMLGINAENKTQAIDILGQKETPGLGAKIDGADFKDNFLDRDLAETRWAVAKDGGVIDQITAATISSRAVTHAVKAAIDVYLANLDEIQKTGE